VTLRVRLGVFPAVIVALAGVGIGCALAAGSSSRLVAGKALYRTYCGQCHELAAAGTGSATGVGPSFTSLRVPYNLAIVAVTAQRAPRGHRIAVEHVTFAQLDDIASFLAAATAANPRLARITVAYP
jgi:mono/diheme cytochrome c family protein